MKKKTTEEQIPLAGTEEGQILARLSERVDKAVQMIQELRRERDTLRAERDEIRNRISAILSSLEGVDV